MKANDLWKAVKTVYINEHCVSLIVLLHIDGYVE